MIENEQQFIRIRKSEESLLMTTNNMYPKKTTQGTHGLSNNKLEDYFVQPKETKIIIIIFGVNHWYPVTEWVYFISEYTEFVYPKKNIRWLLKLKIHKIWFSFCFI